MNFKKYKWWFYIFTFFLITVVATVLSAMKPGDKAPDVSNAILLVGAVYAVVYILYRIFKTSKNKREEQEVIKAASEIFSDNETTTKNRGGFLNKVHLKKVNTKFLLIVVGLVSVILFFYWYQWRPSEIRKSCAEEATKGGRIKTIEDNLYRECLAKRGLKPESLFVK